MRTYNIQVDAYIELWEKVEEASSRQLNYVILDRWLSIFHGITAAGDVAGEDNCYPYIVRDEGKLAWFLLRYL